MFAHPSTDAFKPTRRLPDTADPDADGGVGGAVGGLGGTDGKLVGVDVGAGAGERTGGGEMGAEGVDACCPAGDCGRGAGLLVRRVA
jgi:hypothetical protein